MAKHERFPAIAGPKVALCHVDTWTGHLLTLTGQVFRQGDQSDCFIAFENVDEAIQYANLKVKESIECDCAIFDSSGDYLLEVRPAWTSDPSLPSPVRARVERHPWWKVWA